MSRHHVALIAESTDHRVPAEPGSTLERSVHELIDLLHGALDDGDPVPEEVRALRRALGGHPHPRDEGTLGGRFRPARVCLVAAPPTRHRAIRAELADALVDDWEAGLVVLVPDLPHAAGQDARSRVARLTGRVLRTAPTAAIGVSTALSRLGEAPRGLDEATRALGLCEEGSAVLADDRWFDVTTSRLRDCIAASLGVDNPLGRLDDVRSGVDLRTSLATWLAHDGDVRAAAAELHLHPNSLRYRLQKASRVTGIDLSDPLQRLVAHLALTAG